MEVAHQTTTAEVDNRNISTLDLIEATHQVSNPEVVSQTATAENGDLNISISLVLSLFLLFYFIFLGWAYPLSRVYDSCLAYTILLASSFQPVYI